jgi:hypothetical protein
MTTCVARHHRMDRAIQHKGVDLQSCPHYIASIGISGVHHAAVHTILSMDLSRDRRHALRFYG